MEKRNIINDNLDQILEWFHDGYTVSEVCNNLEISTRNYYYYLKNDEELKLKINKAKEQSNNNVEATFYKRCLGYTIIDEKDIFGIDINGNSWERHEKHKKHVIPDTQSIIFWLKNRMPEKWKNDVDLKNSENEGQGITVINILDEDNNIIEEDIFNSEIKINKKSKIIIDNSNSVESGFD